MKIKPIGARTPAEYFTLIDEPRRSDIKAVHALITKAVPKLKPSIQAGMIGYGTYHYKYASGRECDWPIVALASNKSYISVYVCASENGEYIAEKYKHELPKASIGKSCIRFKKLSDIDVKTLERIVKTGVRIMSKAAKD
ncbi:MAG: DUF1801 domain-containing protein [Bryobacteraceae bacterium]